MLLIHTVQPGDTIDTIAETYNISDIKLKDDNNLPPNYDPIIGQSLMIAYPDQKYTVQEGDTLEGIASAFGVTTKQLLRNNPKLLSRDYFYIGEELDISYDTKKEIEVIGYTNTFISLEILNKTLPNLSYLIILNYSCTALGDLNNINDEVIIKTAKENQVKPIMFVSSMSILGKGSYGITHNILVNKRIQDILINNILIKLNDKGYYGLNLSLFSVLPRDIRLLGLSQ